MPAKRRSPKTHVLRATLFICAGTPLLDAINAVYAAVHRFGPKITGRGDVADNEAWSAVEEACSRARREWVKLRDLLVGKPGVSADNLIDFGRDLDKWLEHAENAAQANVKGPLAPADPTPLPNPGDLLRRAAMLEKHAGTTLDELVTLGQVAPLTGFSKRTLERYLADGKLPEPDFPGGGGHAHKWFWRNLRSTLAKIVRRDLPERFPGSRII